MSELELKAAARYVRRLLLQLADDFGDAALNDAGKREELNQLSDAVSELECKLHKFQESKSS